MKGTPMQNRTPDIEVLFDFDGCRKTPAFDGYRPHHLIRENYLTTGVLWKKKQYVTRTEANSLPLEGKVDRRSRDG